MVALTVRIIITNLRGDILVKYGTHDLIEEDINIVKKFTNLPLGSWLVGYRYLKYLIWRGDFSYTFGIIERSLSEIDYYPPVQYVGERFEKLYEGMKEMVERGERKFDGFRSVIQDILANFVKVSEVITFRTDPSIIELKPGEKAWIRYIFSFKRDIEERVMVISINNAYPEHLVEATGVGSYSEGNIQLNRVITYPQTHFDVEFRAKNVKGHWYLPPIAQITIGDKHAPISSENVLEVIVREGE